MASLDRQMDHAVPELGPDGEAGVVEDAEHLRVVGHRVRDEASDLRAAGPTRQRVEHCRSQAMALPCVGHDERDFRSVRVVDPVVAGDADDRTADPGDDGLALAMVHMREPVDLVRTELGMHGEEPKVGRLRGQRVVEADQVGSVSRPHRTQVDECAVCERDRLDTCRPR